MSRKISFHELSNQLSEAAGISEVDSELFIKKFFTLIEESFYSGDKVVRIKGLGEFSLVDSEEKVKFTPDQVLAESLNAPFSAFSPELLNDKVSNEMLEEINNRVIESTPMPTSVDDIPDIPEDPEETVDHSSSVTTTAPEPIIIVEEEKQEEQEVEENTDETPQQTTIFIESSIPDIEEDQEELADQDNQKSVYNNIIGCEEYGEDDEEDEEETTEDNDENKNSGFGLGFLVGTIVGLAIGAALTFFITNTIADRYTTADAVEDAVEEIELLDEDATAVAPLDTVTVTESPDTVTTTVHPAVATDPVIAVEPVIDTVKAGYLMVDMAKKHYGNKVFWVYIYQENKSKIGNPNMLNAGTKLVIPDKAKYGIDPSDSQSIVKAKALESSILAGK